MEQWKLIPESEGRYSVSDLGRIRREAYSYYANKRFMSHDQKIMKGPDSGCYHRVQFTINGKHFAILAHRLVAAAFIPNPENKPMVNHKDLDKSNNRVDNLEWVTASENIKHWAENRTGYKRSKETGPLEMIPLEGEEFRQFEDLPLFVSSYGRFYGKYRSYMTFLSTSVGENGYQRINITVNNKHLFFVSHRLVAKVFIDNPDELPVVNHLDGDKLNNRADNLEWCSHARNVRHALDYGLKEAVGEKHHACKHSDETIAKVIELLNSGVSYSKTSKATGVSEAQVYRIKSGTARINSTKLAKKEVSSTFILTEDDVYQIKKMVFEGASRKDVAIMFGVKIENISKIVKGRGWKHIAPEYTNTDKKKQNKLTQDQRELVVKMLSEGVSPSIVAKEIGCSYAYLYILKNKAK